MNIKHSHWIDLRELPGSAQEEQSYIRFRDIERVSFIQSSAHEYSVFVSALGEKYLYDVVNSEHEAIALAKNLIEDIENSHPSQHVHH